MNDEISKADSQIASAEAALGRFDDAFQAVEADSERAAEHAWRADSELEEARGERERIKEKQDDALSQRHDLQVSKLEKYLPLNNSHELPASLT